MITHRPAIRFYGVDAPLEPPYILLCNHNAFMDFKVATQGIYPYKANYVVAIDGFIGREWFLRAMLPAALENSARCSRCRWSRSSPTAIT